MLVSGLVIVWGRSREESLMEQEKDAEAPGEVGAAGRTRRNDDMVGLRGRETHAVSNEQHRNRDLVLIANKAQIFLKTV